MSSKAKAIESAVDYLLYMNELIENAITTTHISKEELNKMFDWAEKTQKFCEKFGDKYESALISNGCLVKPTKAIRDLLIHLMNNPVLSRPFLKSALEVYEGKQGFLDAEARVSINSRDQLRKFLLELTILDHGSNYKAELKTLFDPELPLGSKGEGGCSVLLACSHLALTEDDYAENVLNNKLNELSRDTQRHKDEVAFCYAELIKYGNSSDLVRASFVNGRILNAILDICFSVIVRGSTNHTKEIKTIVTKLIESDLLYPKLVDMEKREPLKFLKIQDLLD